MSNGYLTVVFYPQAVISKCCQTQLLPPRPIHRRTNQLPLITTSSAYQLLKLLIICLGVQWPNTVCVSLTGENHISEMVYNKLKKALHEKMFRTTSSQVPLAVISFLPGLQSINRPYSLHNLSPWQIKKDTSSC